MRRIAPERNARRMPRAQLARNPPLSFELSPAAQPSNGLGRRCVSRSPAEETRRQEQDGLQESEHGGERDPHEAEGQGQQPDDRPQDQDQQGQRPAQDKE